MSIVPHLAWMQDRPANVPLAEDGLALSNNVWPAPQLPPTARNVFVGEQVEQQSLLNGGTFAYVRHLPYATLLMPIPSHSRTTGLAPSKS